MIFSVLYKLKHMAASKLLGRSPIKNVLFYNDINNICMAIVIRLLKRPGEMFGYVQHSFLLAYT